MRKILATKDFVLGTFASNCSGGMTVTKLPERWAATWENNEKLGILLDDAGIDFMLPIARWVGYGGETDFHGSVLETMTWATGLLAKTKRITVFATMHVTANHPVVVAKQMATADAISRGRAGLNIVAGWNKPEYEALGLDLPKDHERRYRYAQEWFDLVQKIWTTNGKFDFNGEFFKVKDCYGEPKPWHGERPAIINAAGSGEGRNFAVRNADFLFTPAIDLTRSKAEIGELKDQAKSVGRAVDVLTFAHVVCRPTEQEAKDYWQHFANANADWAAVDNLIALQFANAQSFPHDLLALIRDRMAAGHGGFPLVGTPEQVADGISQLHEAGFKGTTLSFVDYVKEFPYFRDHVLPILEARGLRTPQSERAEEEQRSLVA
jgi:alkanesulfonate monooxygenase SsuD/methylene tetrahydromethanopterin reductase-like flavin-dependent oxidoreductase (luciferase family)